MYYTLCMGEWESENSVVLAPRVSAIPLPVCNMA